MSVPVVISAWAIGTLAIPLLLGVLGAVAGVAIGYVWARGKRAPLNDQRLLMFKVADDLAQYRAFTRLLRDQGDRITASSSEAAVAIVTGLRDMDGNIARLATLLDQVPEPYGSELRAVLTALASPMVSMLGHLQFQDVTQQQIAFLSRLSLVLDQHMISLANQLGDRRSMDRVGNFKDMFNQALDDCVMTSQRDDHHAAAGLDQHEDRGPKIELF